MARLPYMGGMTSTDNLTATEIAKELAEEYKDETRADIVRVIRHYTGTPLLRPLGALNTGTGRKRLYPSDALARAAVLLRLNSLGIPIGVINEAFEHFNQNLHKQFKTTDLVRAAACLQDPAVILALPDRRREKSWRAQLVDLEGQRPWWVRDFLVVRVRK